MTSQCNEYFESDFIACRAPLQEPYESVDEKGGNGCLGGCFTPKMGGKMLTSACQFFVQQLLNSSFIAIVCEWIRVSAIHRNRQDADARRLVDSRLLLARMWRLARVSLKQRSYYVQVAHQ